MLRYHGAVNALGFALPGLLAWHGKPAGRGGRRMKVLIAGGTGFLGRHVSEALRSGRASALLLVARGHTFRPRGRRRGGRAGGCRLRRLAARRTAGRRRDRQPDRHQARAGGRRPSSGSTSRPTRHLIEAAAVSSASAASSTSASCAAGPTRGAPTTTPSGAAEELVRTCAAWTWTILKPGVIYGPGDDMVTHLVKMIRFAPVFPVVGRGDSLLQPVHAGDVAAAVVGALANDRSIGKAYDVVGPERLTLRAVVETVARAVGLRLRVVGTPIWFQRAAVGLMNALFRNPLSTPAQLQMLIDGLYGDPEPARAETRGRAEALHRGRGPHAGGADPARSSASASPIGPGRAGREHREPARVAGDRA